MASPSVTYTFSNSTTADATQVNQNFTDIINGVTDGTKDLSIAALTCAGNVTISGSSTTIGNASSDTLTITASLASTIAVGTTYSYDLGGSTAGLRKVYLGSSDSAARTVAVCAGVVGTSYTLTLPTAVPSGTAYLTMSTAGALSTVVRTVPTVTKLTSGSGDYTTPAGAIYLRIRMVGGGGGGAGSGTTNGTAAGDGGNSTFSVDGGAAILTAGGGTKGTRGGAGGAGGTATISSPAYGTGLAGGTGSGGQGVSSSNNACGGNGGNNALGGGGGGGQASTVGLAGKTNTGGGGGGAGTQSSGGDTGSGGGAGAFIEAIIPSPSAGYDYSVGAAGTAGGAGTSGAAGAAGGSGYIEVWEYYQ
jgi:hypothetical protein